MPTLDDRLFEVFEEAQRDVPDAGVAERLEQLRTRAEAQGAASAW